MYRILLAILLIGYGGSCLIAAHSLPGKATLFSLGPALFATADSEPQAEQTLNPVAVIPVMRLYQRMLEENLSTVKLGAISETAAGDDPGRVTRMTILAVLLLSMVVHIAVARAILIRQL